MQYMLLIYADPDLAPTPGTPEADEVSAAWMRITEEMAPITIAGGQLQPVDTATTVRTNGSGSPALTDGPFAETKEFLAGYYLVDAPDLDTVTGWAARLPIQGRGSVEVRPLVERPTG